MRRRHSILRVTALAAGILLGIVLALPLPDVSAACPPLSEGRYQCELYKAWLPAVVTFSLTPLALLALTDLVLRGLPRPRAKRDFTRETRPDWDADPVLLAASWGVTYEPAERGARTEDEDEDVLAAFETLVARKREERSGGNGPPSRPRGHEPPRTDDDGDPDPQDAEPAHAGAVGRRPALQRLS